ncbi:hypothetical protein BJ508DRAFT_323473 [Ascobolus immersus RN42]|uniref:Uncharacterized protein n=1 Tax=Ascobolus immersus RN42 TaxID=1160509 RepID=A0A3N4IK50_ASCIM|nr:hypothetical protein BJ508DRAFT_323473 [Ascobolus immersus RN42]
MGYTKAQREAKKKREEEAAAAAAAGGAVPTPPAPPPKTPRKRPSKKDPTTPKAAGVQKQPSTRALRGKKSAANLPNNDNAIDNLAETLLAAAGNQEEILSPRTQRITSDMQELEFGLGSPNGHPEGEDRMDLDPPFPQPAANAPVRFEALEGPIGPPRAPISAATQSAADVAADAAVARMRAEEARAAALERRRLAEEDFKKAQAAFELAQAAAISPIPPVAATPVGTALASPQAPEATAAPTNISTAPEVVHQTATVTTASSVISSAALIDSTGNQTVTQAKATVTASTIVTETTQPASSNAKTSENAEDGKEPEEPTGEDQDDTSAETTGKKKRYVSKKAEEQVVCDITLGRYNLSLIRPPNTNEDQKYDGLSEDLEELYDLGLAVGDSKLFEQLRDLHSQVYVRNQLYKCNAFHAEMIAHIYGPVFRIKKDTPSGVKLAQKKLTNQMNAWGSSFQNNITRKTFPEYLNKKVVEMGWKDEIDKWTAEEWTEKMNELFESDFCNIVKIWSCVWVRVDATFLNEEHPMFYFIQFMFVNLAQLIRKYNLDPDDSKLRKEVWTVFSRKLPGHSAVADVTLEHVPPPPPAGVHGLKNLTAPAKVTEADLADEMPVAIPNKSKIKFTKAFSTAFPSNNNQEQGNGGNSEQGAGGDVGTA